MKIVTAVTPVRVMKIDSCRTGCMVSLVKIVTAVTPVRVMKIDSCRTGCMVSLVKIGMANLMLQ